MLPAACAIDRTGGRPRPAIARIALACVLALGASGARSDERERNNQAERQRHRQELREQLRGERLRAPQEDPADAGRRGARDASYLSPDERQALRQQLREQPPWRGQR